MPSPPCFPARRPFRYGLSTTLRGRIRALASSPVPGEGLDAVARSSLIDLSNVDGGNATIAPQVSTLGYVG